MVRSICFVCKKHEANALQLLTCCYCFIDVHFKCQNLTYRAGSRLKETLFSCKPICADSYKRITDMQNSKNSMITDFKSTIESSVSGVSTELREKKKEVKTLTSAIDTSQQFLSSKFDSIISEFNQLKLENDRLKQEVKNLKELQFSLTDVSNNLEMQIDQVHRKALMSNTVFLGVPMSPNEDTLEVISSTMNRIGANIYPNSIVSAARIPCSKRTGIRPIKVIFRDKLAKEQVLEKRNVSESYSPQM